MNDQCLLCQSSLTQPITIKWLLSLEPTAELVICSDCRQNFATLNGQHCCTDCYKPIRTDDLCRDCVVWRAQSNSNIRFTNQALYEYNSAMKAFMHRYKFVGDYQLRQVFATEFSQAAAATNRLVVPIPLSPSTLQTRLFNQTTGLLKIEYVDCLKTIVHHKVTSQSRQSGKQRRMLNQPFELISDLAGTIYERDILIVDDVYTTGTTIHHAAQLLIDNGARSVAGLTLAR